jgi:hypothetical protein
LQISLNNFRQDSYWQFGGVLNKINSPEIGNINLLRGLFLTRFFAIIDSSKNACKVNVFNQNPHIHLRYGMRRFRLHARHGAAGGQVGGPSMDGHDH